MRQPIYDGCAADRTQAVLLQGLRALRRVALNHRISNLLVAAASSMGRTVFCEAAWSEKPLWHSHVHEVKSGQLIAPGIPAAAEHALMNKLVHTYGKTWHTWHTDLDKNLPLGVPQLMMGFTADGQIDPALVQKRDARFGVNSGEKKKSRADIPAPHIDPGADAWTKGTPYQIKDPTGGHAH